MASSYNNVGSTFQQLNKLDSALYYLKLSSQLHAKKKNISGLGTNYQNIGKLYNDKKDLKSALVYFEKSFTFISGLFRCDVCAGWVQQFWKCGQKQQQV